MGILRLITLVFILVASFSSSALGDWYILLPRKRLPKERQMPKNVPVPKIKQNTVRPKPYSVEIQKILSPDFSIPTKSRKLNRKDFEGENVVIFFVDSLFSSFTERLVSKLENSFQKGTVFIVVSTNDADFISIDTFKKLMGVRKTLVTADSYLFKLFQSRLKELNVPSVVVIDKYGFIRFFSPEISKKNVKTVAAELTGILKSLSKG